MLNWKFNDLRQMGMCMLLNDILTKMKQKCVFFFSLNKEASFDCTNTQWRLMRYFHDIIIANYQLSDTSSSPLSKF